MCWSAGALRFDLPALNAVDALHALAALQRLPALCTLMSYGDPLPRIHFPASAPSKPEQLSRLHQAFQHKIILKSLLYQQRQLYF